MTSLKKISVLALLLLIANPAWSRNVDFCKVVRTFDTTDLSGSPHIDYEDCSGVAFLDYAKDLVKADCWPGAIDLHEGKCELYKDKASDVKTDTTEDLEYGAQ